MTTYRSHATCQRCTRLKALGDLVPVEGGYVCAHSWCTRLSLKMAASIAAQHVNA